MRTVVVAEVGEVYAAMRYAITRTSSLVIKPEWDGPTATSNGSLTVRGNAKEVTNLGWLLRNWKTIHDIHVTTKWPSLRESDPYQAMLAVRMLGGAIYVTGWVDRHALFQWLVRPVLRGRPVYWDHTLYAIGEGHYHEIMTNESYPNPKEKQHA